MPRNPSSLTTRRGFLKTSAALTSALAFGRSLGNPVTAGQPRSVLMISLDDVRPWFGAYRSPHRVRTPHFDRLAAQGMLHTRAYCTSPACAPSRAAVFSGLGPWRTGLYENGQSGNPLMAERLSLPRCFGAAGWQTGCFGKVGHGWDATEFSHHVPLIHSPPGKAEPSMFGGPIANASVDDMGDAQVVAEATEWLDHASKDRPVFLAVGMIKAHHPWDLPAPDWAALDPTRVPPSAAPANDLSDVPPIGRSMAELGNGLEKFASHAEISAQGTSAANIAAYLGCIEFLDTQIGRLLAAWSASPHGRNGIVVVWSDHGWHHGEKEHWSKFTLWEEATHVPLLFAGAGIPSGHCDAITSNLDIYPTLTTLAGITPPADLDGQALLSTWADPTRAAATERVALTYHGPRHVAVRSDRWRYIRYSDGTEELYDHLQDPAEWTNLASDPAWTDVRTELAAAIPPTPAAPVPFGRGRQSIFGADGMVQPQVRSGPTT